MFVADPKLRTMSKMRSRSRSRVRSRSISSPPTPRTPSNDGRFQVSDGEDPEPVFRFDCKVIMNSGEPFDTFKCDLYTSMGYVRNCITQIVKDMRSNGLLLEFDSFLLLRGEQICSNDYIKIFEMFPNFKTENCVLTIVMLQKKKKVAHCVKIYTYMHIVHSLPCCLYGLCRL